MSGPVTDADAAPVEEHAHPGGATLEVTESREAKVGALVVRRALPRRARRTVGAWCFVDHMGPADLSEGSGVDIGPHPHIGLQTVTWLLAGEVLHRDGFGSEQLIRPGQLNLMTAGHGVAHAEEGTPGHRGELHGVQLWVAQPESTRHGAPAFEHHADLPQLDLGCATATVIVGELSGARSPARRDTDHVGVDLDLRRGETVLPLEPGWEHAVVVLTGAVSIGGRHVGPGHLAYLGTGRGECVFSVAEPSRALLIGGVPMDEQILMWWNYVARTRDEILQAHREWTEESARFGHVESRLDRIDVDPPPWRDSGGS